MAAVFGIERRWPRSIEIAGTLSNSMVIFGPDSNDSRKEFGVTLEERLDGSEANKENKWTLWSYRVDHSNPLSEVRPPVYLLFSPLMQDINLRHS